jgi:hypothetical protein
MPLVDSKQHLPYGVISASGVLDRIEGSHNPEHAAMIAAELLPDRDVHRISVLTTTCQPGGEAKIDIRTPHIFKLGCDCLHRLKIVFAADMPPTSKLEIVNLDMLPCAICNNKLTQVLAEGFIHFNIA